MLQSMGSQQVGPDLVTEQQQCSALELWFSGCFLQQYLSQQSLLAIHFTGGTTDCTREATRPVWCHTADWDWAQNKDLRPLTVTKYTPPTPTTQECPYHQTGKLSPGWTALACSCSIHLLSLTEEDSFGGWLQNRLSLTDLEYVPKDASFGNGGNW